MADEKLSDSAHRLLLDVARKSIAAKLAGNPFKAPSKDELAAAGPGIAERRGCFVTLHKRGDLRGCIGVFEGEGPLWENVSRMALQAAFHDPRFPSLKENELKDVDIEISALTPLRKTTDVEEIKVGTHGIYITSGYRRGVLLPQVATERGWDRKTFLEQTCVKAGLDTNAWKRPEATIEIFSADVFGELDEPTGGCC